MKQARRMNKQRLIRVLMACLLIVGPGTLSAQGLHFSQYYNAPMLVSPANTGLMSDKDFRLGANYRSQWQSLPVPFNSFSLFGDCQVFRRHNGTNWLGVGAAMFSDRAGDGNLSLSRYEGFVAYHIQLGQTQMISFGGSVASVERTVDFSKLTFDTQWDGYVFNNTLANGEPAHLGKAHYTTINAGLNYAIFPSEMVYFKFGGSVANINQPSESFYNQSNPVGMRETGYMDMLARAGKRLVINPSVYYTTQQGASELMFGSLFTIMVGNDDNDGSLVLGAYSRWNESIIGTFGYDWKGLRVMMSYDYTTSELGTYIAHNGALEFGLRFQGSYGDGKAANSRSSYNCPRF